MFLCISENGKQKWKAVCKVMFIYQIEYLLLCVLLPPVTAYRFLFSIPSILISNVLKLSLRRASYGWWCFPFTWWLSNFFSTLEYEYDQLLQMFQVILLQIESSSQITIQCILPTCVCGSCIPSNTFLFSIISISNLVQAAVSCLRKWFNASLLGVLVILI